MWSSPRSRARFNRACVRRALASLSTTAMMFLQQEVRILQADHSSMAWSRALRAADSASRISPFSFDGDKRGRMRQFYESVVFFLKFLWSDTSLRLLADPSAIPYLGPNLPLGATTSSACPLVADRVSMPRKAAVVPVGRMVLFYNGLGETFTILFLLFFIHNIVLSCVFTVGFNFFFLNINSLHLLN